MLNVLPWNCGPKHFHWWTIFHEVTKSARAARAAQMRCCDTIWYCLLKYPWITQSEWQLTAGTSHSSPILIKHIIKVCLHLSSQSVSPCQNSICQWYTFLIMRDTYVPVLSLFCTDDSPWPVAAMAKCPHSNDQRHDTVTKFTEKRCLSIVSTETHAVLVHQPEARFLDQSCHWLLVSGAVPKSFVTKYDY